MAYKGMTRQQKEAVGLLSIGTFLEYFDLMLYVHMAVLLNDLFFPKTDPLTTQLLTAFTFSTTFFFRPIGGYIIGLIGDTIGRKITVMITTFIMAICCIVMASVKTYVEIGLMASVIMIGCRILQGFSSMGEKVGAQLYLSEMLKQPYLYIYSWIIHIKSELGGLFALLVASFALSSVFSWRLAFLVGAVIAVIAVLARTKLRETVEFTDYKRRLKARQEIFGDKASYVDTSIEPTDKKAVFIYFIIRLIGPACFYITYAYTIHFMKGVFSLNADGIINQNLKVSLLTILGLLVTLYFTKKHHPIKVAKYYMVIFSICLIFLPYFFNNVQNLSSLVFLQFITFLPGLCMSGVEVACFKHLPVAKRFTFLATMFGLSAALSYTVVSFSLIPLTKYCGYYALWIVYIPLIYLFFYSIIYLKKLEIKKGTYNNYPNETVINVDTAKNEEDYEYELGEEYSSFKVECSYSKELLDKLIGINNTAFNKINIKLIEKAIVFIKKWHDGQMRKSGNVPYYSHPLEVASILSDYLFKTDVLVAAILHDVVEDSDCTVKIIEKEFNSRIAEIVDRLTKIRFENNIDIKLTLEETVNRLHQSKDYEAQLIKKIDRLHNLYTIEGLSKEKQKKMARETNNILIRWVAFVGDKLNIAGILGLEDKLFEHSHKTLKK